MEFSCRKKNICINTQNNFKNKSNFYCLNCRHSFRTENKLKFYEKVCKNKDIYGIALSSKIDRILEFNQYMKSDKMPFIIYADIEYLIRKTDGCSSNPEKSSTTTIGQYLPCGYSISTISEFDHIENKHTLYRAKYCLKKFCNSLRE